MAEREVDVLTRAGTVNPYMYFRGPQALAVAAARMSGTDPGRSRGYADRAAALLTRAAAGGLLLTLEGRRELAASAALF